MPHLGTVESTLFVPMLGRIYASENFPAILNDVQALALKPKLPEHLAGADTQTQYTFLASASRSFNMDRAIQHFLAQHPDGVVCELGCGLETTYWRNDNGRTPWFGVDLPDVIAYRRQLLPEAPRAHYVAGSAFSPDWIEQLRAQFPTQPVLVTASGLFYYFPKDQVVDLMRMLQERGPLQIVFDTVNESGMKRMGGYLEQVGHGEAIMYFYVNKADELAREIGGGMQVLSESDFYRDIPKAGLSLSTKLTMKGSDLLHMVKMVHLRLS